MPAFPLFAEKRPLPAQLSLEHLRKEARARLTRLRSRDPAAQLADAQRIVAQACGFRSWRALKSAIEKQASEEIRACPGFYRHDPTRIANLFLEVRLEGGNLVLQGLGGAAMTLQRQADGRFAAPGLAARYDFARDADGGVTALTVDVDGRQSRMMRIGQAEADAIRAANASAREDQARPRTAIAVPEVRLARHVGHYDSGFGLTMDVTLENGRLHGQVNGQQKLPMDAESEDDFFFAALPAQMCFRIENDRSVAMGVHQNGSVTFLARVSVAAATEGAAVIARRFAEQIRPRSVVRLPAETLPRYAGRYRIDEKREMIVEVDDGHLFAQLTGQERCEIHAEAPDRFFWTIVPAQLSFISGPDGTVTHAILHQAGRETHLPRIASA